jgi:hypothetical protein
VPNWSISWVEKVKLTRCQNHHHHEGVFDTWTNWARPQDEWPQEPVGQPNSLATRLGFEAIQPSPWLPCIYTRRRRLSRWRNLVEATPLGRLAMRLGRPASTWCQTNFSKSVEVPFTPINTPLKVKVDTPHSTCSSPLVKVSV